MKKEEIIIYTIYMTLLLVVLIIGILTNVR
jgi:hypothetical protein